MQTDTVIQQPIDIQKPVNQTLTTTVVQQSQPEKTKFQKLLAGYVWFSTLVAELQFFIAAPCLIAGAGCWIGQRYLAGAILYVIAFSLWISAGLSLFTNSIGFIMKKRSVGNFTRLIASIFYLVSNVLMIVGASLIIGPYVSVGTGFEGFILFVIGAALFLVGTTLYHLIHIGHILKINGHEMNKKHRAFEWLTAIASASYLILSVCLLIGACLYMAQTRALEVPADILWIIAGGFLLLATVCNTIGKISPSYYAPTPGTVDRITTNSAVPPTSTV
jgi:hypothetical protein